MIQQRPRVLQHLHARKLPLDCVKYGGYPRKIHATLNFPLLRTSCFVNQRFMLCIKIPQLFAEKGLILLDTATYCCFEIKSVFGTSVHCFFFDYALKTQFELSRAEGRVTPQRNDLNGKNYFELARVKLQLLFEGNSGEIDLTGPARGFGYTVSQAILIQVYGIFWSKFGHKVFSFS